MRKANALLMICLLFVFSACVKDELVLPERISGQDNSELNERKPVKPDYIEIITDFDTKVVFTWPAIDTERVKAIHVDFDKDGSQEHIEITDFENNLVLEGLEVGKAYKFTLVAVGLSGDLSKEHVVSASPKPMVVDLVSESISVSPFTIDDAEIRWYNSTGHKVLMQVTINDRLYTSVASDTSSGLFAIEGLERDDYLIQVAVQDTLGNVSSTRSFPLKVVSESLANTEGWIATANSEHHPGENTGLASALIDGDLNTIWHTRWDGGAPGYPHWAQFDMLKPALVSKIEMAARQNNTMGMTKFRIQGSLNGTQWVTILDNQTFNPDEKAFQTYRFDPAEYRYLKLIPLEGRANYTHLAEFRVYTYK